MNPMQRTVRTSGVDPKEKLIGILMIQLSPYAHLNIRPAFQNAVTQAITD
jgi:hypothetical protein